MRIAGADIKNFRGIREAKIRLPDDARIVCLIGPGDSNKSNILQAIQYALWPNNYIQLSHTDYYQCDTANEIEITVTVAEMPALFLTMEKYGLYLRGNIDDADDEPVDGKSPLLTIQFRADSSLNPEWTVIGNNKEPKHISASDRKRLPLARIGENYSSDLVWGRGSVLNNYIEAQAELKRTINQLISEAASIRSPEVLNQIGDIITSCAKSFGIGIDGTVTSKFVYRTSTSLGSFGLFDDRTPLFQRGTGTQRLLSMALNINAHQNETVLIIDEVENGLEPYRLRTLLNELRAMFSENGQVFMTTHSPTTLVELDAKHLYRVLSRSGSVSLEGLVCESKTVSDGMQRTVRKQPEAFLCPRIVLCEGKTEFGLMKALDNHLRLKEEFRIASKGVYFAEGEGSNWANRAKVLRRMGYDVCVVMDHDRKEDEQALPQLRALRVPVFRWEKGNAIEDQLFADAPKKTLRSIIAVVKKLTSSNPLLTALEHLEQNDCIENRARCAALVKKEGCFKRIDLGEKLGDLVFQDWDVFPKNSTTYQVITKLKAWIKGEGFRDGSP